MDEATGRSTVVSAVREDARDADGRIAQGPVERIELGEPVATRRTEGRAWRQEVSEARRRSEAETLNDRVVGEAEWPVGRHLATARSNRDALGRFGEDEATDVCLPNAVECLQLVRLEQRAVEETNITWVVSVCGEADGGATDDVDEGCATAGLQGRRDLKGGVAVAEHEHPCRSTKGVWWSIASEEGAGVEEPVDRRLVEEAKGPREAAVCWAGRARGTRYHDGLCGDEAGGYVHLLTVTAAVGDGTAVGWGRDEE